MSGCGHWIRDEDDVAAFMCGDFVNGKTILCKECKNESSR